MEQANNVEGYLEILSRYREKGFEIYYRGQSEEYSSHLDPKICRIRGLLENEATMLGDLSVMCADDFKGTKSFFEFLSKAQHYALPTRLLDLTMDEKVALYFAINEEKSPYPGNVFVYIQEGVEIEDARVMAISLIIRTGNTNLDFLCNEFTKESGKEISPEEFLELIEKPLFIKYREDFEINNQRLLKQMGTFIIATNDTSDGIIKPNLISLDRFDPNLIIRIPYEFKKKIKDELNDLYDINDHHIFPELPFAARFLERKYEKFDEVVYYEYKVREKRDISLGDYRRITIIIELSKLYPFHDIHKLSKKIIECNKEEMNEVWVSIAKNSDDYITSNYLYEGRWQKNLQETRYSLKPYPNLDNEGYSWKTNNSFTIVNDYNQNSIFDSDRNLFVYHWSIYQNIFPIYSNIKRQNDEKNLVELVRIIKENEDKFLENFSILQDYGRSHNVEFDEFLDLFSKWLSRMDNLKFCISNIKAPPSIVFIKVTRIMDDIYPIIDKIEKTILHWRDKIGITEIDIDKIKPEDYKKPDYQYKQTIPISKNAIKVWFEFTIERNDSLIRIHGNTNLFDGAELLISVSSRESGYFGQSKSPVKENIFVSDWFSNKGKRMSNGNYNISFFLSLPSVQNQQFVDKAGREYENITGEFVNREGVGPTLEFSSNYLLVENDD